MIALYIILLVVILVGGWTWRYFKVRDMANEFGLDTADLMIKDVFGSEGAVERELAATALSRSQETHRQLDRERAARLKAEEQRLADERARVAAATAEVSIKPADRPREARLQELDSLAKQGLITAEEAAARRQAILDEI